VGAVGALDPGERRAGAQRAPCGLLTCWTAKARRCQRGARHCDLHANAAERPVWKVRATRGARLIHLCPRIGRERQFLPSPEAR
jgi:hypothetical protein